MATDRSNNKTSGARRGAAGAASPRRQGASPQPRRRTGTGSSSATRASSTGARRTSAQHGSSRASSRSTSQSGRSARTQARSTSSVRRSTSVPSRTQTRSSASSRAQSRPSSSRGRSYSVSKSSGASSRRVQASSSRGSGAPRARGTSGTTEFKGFFVRHLRFTLPATLLIVFMLGFGVYDTVAFWGKIHVGVSVQGVDVGGMTVTQAAEKLSDELGDKVQKTSFKLYEGSGSDTVTDSGTDMSKAYAASSKGSDIDGDGKVEKWSITADTIGADVDGDGLAKTAYKYGREGNFLVDRLKGWFVSTDYNATITYNAESFTGLTDDIDKAIGTKIVDSKIKISKGKASVKEGSDGYLTDTEALVKRMSAVFFDDDATYCTVPMKTVSMHIKPDTAQKVADQVNAAVASNVSVVYGSSSWTLNANTLGNLVSQKVLEPGQYLSFGNSTQKVETGDASQAQYDTSTGTDPDSNYVLQAYVDQKKFDSYLLDVLGSKASGGARDASFYIKNGKVVIKPSKTGTGPDRATAELALQDMLFGDQASTQRTITLTDTTVQPSRSTEQAKKMGIKERLSTWSIPLSGTANRQSNIKLLCKMINGSIVAPGESWSFNETTGERTAAKGFSTAPVIVGGRHEDQLGGGICQVATCVFNAACYAGLGIGTRANHAFYISAYDDKGFADATVSWETPDLKWTNDMSNYVMLTADASDGNVTVSLWGTDEGRTVTCDRGKWKKGAKYKTIKEKDDSLAKGTTKVTQTGRDGRSIYIRYIAKDKDGKVLHDINFHSVYSAQNEIIKVGTGKGSTDDDEDDSDDS